jgi:hypothetical protein
MTRILAVIQTHNGCSQRAATNFNVGARRQHAPLEIIVMRVIVMKNMVAITGDNIAYSHIAGLYKDGHGHGLQINEEDEQFRDEILKLCDGIAENIHALRVILEGA